MSLRIYNNSSVINSHRNLQINTKSVEKSFEKVSSGLRINRAADEPASLVVSERLRSQIASVEQAVRNIETDISVLQTAEASLEEINNTLVHMRQLAVHAANEGANDKYALEADQQEIEAALQSIDKIARTTSFGNKKLLDGSSGVGGITTNPLVEFVEASPKTQASGAEGYDVRISQTATKSIIIAEEELSADQIEDGETLRIIEKGKVAEYTTNSQDNVLSVVSKLNQAIKRNGLDVIVYLSDNDKLVIQHKEFGSKYTFSASSTSEGIFSDDDGEVLEAFKGADVRGYLNGEATVGDGQVLIGAAGSATVDGLKVRYLGQEGGLIADDDDSGSEFVGKVFVDQNSLIFQTGPDYGHTTKVTLGSVNTDNLGRGVENTSRFSKLNDINVQSHQGASDGMKLIDEAITTVTSVRGKIGATQKNDLESGLRNMRTFRENLVAAESTIRDSDYAEEVSKLTKNQVMQNASFSIMAQNNANLRNILSLLP